MSWSPQSFKLKFQSWPYRSHPNLHILGEFPYSSWNGSRKNGTSGNSFPGSNWNLHECSKPKSCGKFNKSIVTMGDFLYTICVWSFDGICWTFICKISILQLCWWRIQKWKSNENHRLILFHNISNHFHNFQCHLLATSLSLVYGLMNKTISMCLCKCNSTCFSPHILLIFNVKIIKLTYQILCKCLS